ncbi:GatB/YqeY domain-containing protein [Patescibacteria group bacterium]|nr:MAG: GatB/YqeY domain-containing protein [Patescibacteria group bacterium]
MTLRENLDADFKSALKEKNELKLSVVRMIKAALMNAEISSGGKGSFDDAKIFDIIRKEAKKRNDSIAAYEQGGRNDLAEKEKQELAILQNYLPQAMAEDEIKALVQKTIADLGAGSTADFGKVMKEAVARAEGRADGKIISRIVKDLLA